MATRTALLLFAVVAGAGLLCFAASMVSIVSAKGGFAGTPWIAIIGAFLAFGAMAGFARTLQRHLDALRRLREGVMMLQGNAAEALPVLSSSEVAKLRDAVDTMRVHHLERQAAPDRRLTAVLGSIDEAIVVMTTAGQVSLVNAAARRLLGGDRVAVGTSLFAALSRRAVETAIHDSRAAGGPVTATLYTVESEMLAAKVCHLGDHGGAVFTFPTASFTHPSGIEHDLALHETPPPPKPVTKDTKLTELPVFVFDCETTGLNVKQDRIVALGGVRMLGRQIFRSVTLDRLVDPDRPIPRSSTAIHGITDAMVLQAGAFETHWPDLDALMRGTVMVGHNVAFDIAQLRWAAKRSGIEWEPPQSLDTLLLLATLEPAAPGYDLDTVAERFGVNIRGRHTALGDSLVTAEIFERLIPLLAERNVATLGEAVAFGQRSKAFVKRQRESGWFDEPSD